MPPHTSADPPGPADDSTSRATNSRVQLPNPFFSFIEENDSDASELVNKNPRSPIDPRQDRRAAHRHVALLRAINVGGHVVKMDALRRAFESLSFSNVQTFIASGNVIFEYERTSGVELESVIEARLQKLLGYPVLTFVRSPAELTAVAEHAPFATGELEGASVYVGFVKLRPSRVVIEKVMALRTDLDDFHIREREVYWLRRRVKERAGEPGPPLERALGAPLTTRNITTVRKIAAKYCQ